MKGQLAREGVCLFILKKCEMMSEGESMAGNYKK